MCHLAVCRLCPRTIVAVSWATVLAVKGFTQVKCPGVSGLECSVDEPNVAVTGDSRVSRFQHAMLNMHANIHMHTRNNAIIQKYKTNKLRAITGMCEGHVFRRTCRRARHGSNYTVSITLCCYTATHGIVSCNAIQARRRRDTRELKTDRVRRARGLPRPLMTFS